MNTLILLNHSDNNRELAEITAPNTWSYSARHHYDLLTVRIGWEDHLAIGFDILMRHLRDYEVVVTAGSDVLFTNHALTVEGLLQPDDHVVMSLETLGETAGYSADGFSPLNNDLVLWRRTPETVEFIRTLAAATPVWMKKRLLWQQHLAEEYLERGCLRHCRLTAPRVLQSTVQPGTSRWQVGDFALHLLAFPYAVKCALARHHLPLVVR